MSEQVSEKKANFFVRTGRRISKWFREMKSELKKVVWPTPKQVVNNTLVVLAMVLVIGAVIWITDAILLTGVNFLLGKL